MKFWKSFKSGNGHPSAKKTKSKNAAKRNSNSSNGVNNNGEEEDESIYEDFAIRRSQSPSSLSASSSVGSVDGSNAYGTTFVELIKRSDSLIYGILVYYSNYIILVYLRVKRSRSSTTYICFKITENLHRSLSFHFRPGTKLGVTVSGSLPETGLEPRVSGLHPGSWAQRSDVLCAGDVVVGVNGADASVMTQAQLEQALDGADRVQLEVRCQYEYFCVQLLLDSKLIDRSFVSGIPSLLFHRPACATAPSRFRFG